MTTLVLVESPAKAKTIQKYLGQSYIVRASFGHIRDLSKKNMGIDTANNFKPSYITISTRAKQLKTIKSLYKECTSVILASDEDREGEAIAWHIAVVLGIDLQKKNRIVFHEITKSAIETAIQNPRQVDLNMVNAQQARRILDRLVGFELSPILWKHVKGKLSAGRVQSIATKLVVDKEKEIVAFQEHVFFSTVGYFEQKIIGNLNKKFEKKDDVFKFLNDCKKASYQVENITIKRIKKLPQPPFITSTIQQEAGKRFHLSAKSTMSALQKLYENGLITYHRTDSTILSDNIMKKIKEYILEKYSKEYLSLRKFNKKTKCAQEAHEAIRPTNISKKDIDGFGNIEIKIYNLIWKRTIASQMSALLTDVYTMKIKISTRDEKFIAKAEKVIFDGYRIIYNENIPNKDDSDSTEKMSELFGEIKKDQKLKNIQIVSTEKYKNPPAHYSEATLIKQMETNGIGRPSTFASIVTTIQDRKYVIKQSSNGNPVKCLILTLSKNEISEGTKISTIGKETKKLFPTDIGKIANDFLVKNFDKVMDINFTATVEQDLDKIVDGNQIWSDIVGKFYKQFHPNVVKLSAEKSMIISKGKRLVGNDISTGNSIYAYLGKFGPVLQIGEDGGDRTFVTLDNKYSIDTVTEEEANSLTLFPKTIGTHDGSNIEVKNGRYGYYLVHGGKNYKIIEPYNQYLKMDEAIKCISENTDNTAIKSFGTISIRNGKYGPYIQNGKTFVSIPDNKIPCELTKEDCEAILATKNSRCRGKKKAKKVKKAPKYSKKK